MNKAKNYFLSLEKRQHFKMHISKLKTTNDRKITTPNAILEQGEMFYKTLYTAAPCNNSKYKQQLKIIMQKKGIINVIP